MDIELIRCAIQADSIRVTDHADEEMAADDLTLDDVLDSVLAGEVIQDYPSDHRLPSCLVYSKSADAQHLHTVWA